MAKLDLAKNVAGGPPYSQAEVCVTSGRAICSHVGARGCLVASACRATGVPSGQAGPCQKLAESGGDLLHSGAPMVGELQHSGIGSLVECDMVRSVDVFLGIRSSVFKIRFGKNGFGALRSHIWGILEIHEVARHDFLLIFVYCFLSFLDLSLIV